MDKITGYCYVNRHLFIGKMSKRQSGFTLIELMMVVVVVAILVTVAIPSYLEYARRSDASLAQQEMQKIAEQLERHRAKNFTYRGFDPNYLYGVTGAMSSVTLPRGASGAGIKYTITLRDGDDTTKLLSDASDPPVIRGRRWVMKAEANDIKNYTFLLTSEGLRCKNKTKANVDYISCGTTATGSENW